MMGLVVDGVAFALGPGISIPAVQVVHAQGADPYAYNIGCTDHEGAAGCPERRSAIAKCGDVVRRKLWFRIYLRARARARVASEQV